MTMVCAGGKRRSRRLFRGSRGFEMINVLLFVLFVAGATYLIVARNNNSKQQQNENDTINGLIALVGQMGKLYNGQTFPAGNLFTPLNTAGAFPPGFKVTTATSTVTHPLGGTVVVTGNGASYDIVLNGISNDRCVAISAASIQPTNVTVNGAAVAVPVTTAAAAGACNAGANANSIDFTLVN